MKATTFILAVLLLSPAACAFAYNPGDTLNLAIEVTDPYNQGVTNEYQTCTFTTWYPNRTMWLDQVESTSMGLGLYVNDSYTIPDASGVYLMVANCSNTTDWKQAAGSFAVNNLSLLNVVSGVWNETTSIHATSGSTGKAVIDILADTSELQANQNWNVWDDSTRILTALDEDDTVIDISGQQIQGITLPVDVNPVTLASGAVDSTALAASAVAEIVEAVDAQGNVSHGIGVYNSTANPPSASVIADAVWDETSTGHTDPNKAGYQLWTRVESISTEVDDLWANQDWNPWDAGTRTLTALDEDDTSIDLDGSRVLLSSATEGQIDAIEADTNELQANQNWNVWDDASRALSEFGFTVALNSSGLSSIDSMLNSSHGIGSYNSSGVGSATAEEVWAYSSRTLSNYSNLLCNASLYGFFPNNMTDVVKDPSGSGVSDVHVVAYAVGQSSNQFADSWTDANGNWELWLIPGEYSIQFYKTGYGTMWENRTVT